MWRTSQGRRLPRVFQVFSRRSSVSGAGGMSGASGAVYFATCITFFVDENHMARLAPKPLPIGRTAAFLFGSSLSRSCHTARACDYVIKTSHTCYSQLWTAYSLPKDQKKSEKIALWSVT